MMQAGKDTPDGAVPIAPALLTEEEAARYLAVSRSFLRDARSNGTRGRRTPGPPWVRLGGGRAIRYRVSDLNSWISAHRVEAR